MVAAVKYFVFVENVAEKVHNLGADVLKIALTNTAPNQTTHVGLSNITEITAGNGYAAGGSAITITASAQSAGVYSLVGNDLVFTAAGGTIGPFRYAVLYNDTPTSPADPLIQSWDYGSSITLQDGETFTVDFGTSILTLT